MSLLDRIRARARAEGGFTLVELIVASTSGMVIVLAGFALIDSSTRASSDVQDRVDTVQRGRGAMEQVTQRLRSQVCLGTSLPAITQGDDNSVTFYAQLNDGVFRPERRRLTYSNGSIVEDIWQGTGTPPAMVYPPLSAPTTTRLMIAGVTRAKDDAGADVPVFRYYAFVGNDPARPALLLQTPLSAADMARVVKVSVSFDARPTRRPAQGNRVDTTFQNDVFVRTADPTDPDHSPQCL